MTRQKQKKSTVRGRPASPFEGAAEAVENVRALKKHFGLSDEELAARIGVNQSSVNRALGRDPPRLTPTLRLICNYAEILARSERSDFTERGRAQLARAVGEVWDGTPRGLEKLLSLLRLLSDFNPAK